MFSILQKKIDEKNLLESVLRWARKNKSPGSTNTLFFYTRKGEFLSEYKKKQSTPVIGLILVEKGLLFHALQSLSLQQEKDLWIKIGNTRDFEIWERNCLSSGCEYVRHGLSDDEKDILLLYARNSIESFLEDEKVAFLKDGMKNDNQLKAKKTYQGLTHSRFLKAREKARVDVALWVNGQLRGSQIAERDTLTDAVYDAAIKATRDIRFKPLTLSELKDARIQVTYMSNLLIPLTPSDIDANEIWGTKGYLALTKSNAGWFVPAVFNCLSFDTLRDFLEVLTRKKLGAAKQDPTYFYFNVIDFIESENGGQFLSGPILYTKKNASEKSKERVTTITDALYSYIQKNQGMDGNIIFINNPLTGESSDIDWVRNAFTAHALTQYGVIFNNTAIKNAGYLQYLYLKENGRHAESAQYCLYLAQAAYYSADVVAVKYYEEYIVAHYEEQLSSPLFALQVALFFIEERNKHLQLEDVALQIAISIFATFKEMVRKGERFQLAMFSDLVPLLAELSRVLKREDLHVKAQDVLSWYRDVQNEDGSFPSSVYSVESYSRGTIKVLESLVRSGLLSKDDQILSQGLLYVQAMQYDKDSLFFVSSNHQEAVLGGIRHDFHNPSVWIDSIAHAVLFILYVKRNNLL